MIRRETWFFLVILAALIGFAVYLNRRSELALANATPTTGIEYVFAPEEGTVASIEIASDSGEIVRVVRDPDNLWLMELPSEAPADPGMAEAAATQVSSLRIIDEIQGDLEIFGLDHPVYKITIGFGTQKEHTLDVGSETPTKSGYYVRLDEKRMLITTLSGIDSLLNLLTNPPYKETPIPSSVPSTSTPEPELSGSSTPTP
jgi:hypothetical protein